ncbi:ROK family protein [Niabella ginsenosidivorans]|uniref:ROK family protein n=1 Tax=Niabella ginsenosidivorans TaxID=1176587 RepID=UPI0021CD4CF6|nr:ROK family protein [Niabella ginsenosidivorans]
MIKLLTAAGYDIGRGVSILIHLFNPDMVILSGRGSQVGRLWLAPVLQAVNEHCIPRLANSSIIKVSNIGYRAELIGAAALVLESLVKGKEKSRIPRPLPDSVSIV